MSYITSHRATSNDSSKSIVKSSQTSLNLRKESTVTSFGVKLSLAPASKPRIRSRRKRSSSVPNSEYQTFQLRRRAHSETSRRVKRKVSFGEVQLVTRKLETSQEGQPVLLKQSQQSVASFRSRSFIRTSPQSPLSNLLFHKFDYSKSDIISRQKLITESLSFPSSSRTAQSSELLEADRKVASAEFLKESRQIRQRKSRFTPTQAVGVAVMTSLIVAAVVLVTALMFQPDDVFVLSQSTSTAARRITPTASPETVSRSNKGLNLTEFRLTSPLTQITSDSQVFHEQGFLHRGPVYGVGNGTYLVNGTEIFLITDSNPPALQQITGRSQMDKMTFSLILGLAMTRDGSEMYISDYYKSVVRLYIVEYNKMVDVLTATYNPNDEFAVYIPDLHQPSVMELYSSSLFIVTHSNTGSPKLLQLNVYTQQTIQLPSLPTAAQFAIRDMAMRDNRLYACANNEIWALDTILIDSSFHMNYGSEDIGVTPTWERVISPDLSSMAVSDEIGDCRAIEISPDLSQIYIVNRLSGEQRDSILKYNFSLSLPGAPKKFTSTSIKRIRSLSVRPAGTGGLLLSDKALYSLSFNHIGNPDRPCMYCAESPPGSGYESYNAKLTEDIWITQSQSTCYSKEENLMAAFNEDRQLEGQLRYYKCKKERLFWDGYETWYNTIPYVCSVDSLIKEARFEWSCEVFTCNLMTSGPHARRCQNEGTCMYQGQSAPAGSRFLCVCQNGFYGERCEKGRAAITENQPAVTDIPSSDVPPKSANPDLTQRSTRLVKTKLPPVNSTVASSQAPLVEEEAANRRPKLKDEAIVGSITGSIIVLSCILLVLGLYCHKQKKKRNAVSVMSAYSKKKATPFHSSSKFTLTETEKN